MHNGILFWCNVKWNDILRNMEWAEGHNVHQNKKDLGKYILQIQNIGLLHFIYYTRTQDTYTKGKWVKGWETSE